MKICIVSDSHDNRKLLDIAVTEAKSLGATAIIHCGDVVAPTTLRVLQKYGLPVHLVHGNNTGDLYSTAQLAHEPGSVINYYGKDASLKLAKRRIFVVHFPHYARAMGTTGDWDIVCCGHDHRPEISHIDTIKNSKTLFINPGTVGGVGASPTYVFGDLKKMKFEIRKVPVDEDMAYNKPPVSVHS